MEQTQTWYSKNKLIIIVIVVLGIFALYAWKTDLTFASYFNVQNVEQKLWTNRHGEDNLRMIEND
jgi:hypothetical protein